MIALGDRGDRGYSQPLRDGTMQTELSRLAGRFLAGYGIADCSPEVCAEHLSPSTNCCDAPLQLLSATSDVSAAFRHLSAISWPATRHVAFSAPRGCTVFINNSRNGSDYADQKVWLARHLQSRFARIVSQQIKTWANGTDREVIRYAAAIFELYDPKGELIRSVACVNDGGRWCSNESGHRHPI